MLDKRTKNKLREIAFSEDEKPKERVSAAKLMLSLGLETEAVLSLLHTLIEDDNCPSSQKVKAIDLVDKYEVKTTDELVDDTTAEEQRIMREYNL